MAMKRSRVPSVPLGLCHALDDQKTQQRTEKVCSMCRALQFVPDVAFADGACRNRQMLCAEQAAESRCRGLGLTVSKLFESV